MQMIHNCINLRLKPSQQNVDIGITKLEACLKSVSQWMSNNFLKLNENKTEYMVIGSNRNLSKFSSTARIVLHKIVEKSVSKYDLPRFYFCRVR